MREAFHSNLANTPCNDLILLFHAIISLPSTRFCILNLCQVTLRYTLSLSVAARTRWVISCVAVKKLKVRLFCSCKVVTLGWTTICTLQCVSYKPPIQRVPIRPNSRYKNKISQMYETLRSLLSKWVLVGTVAGEMLWKRAVFPRMIWWIILSTRGKTERMFVTEQDWKLKVQICQSQWQ
jgi:hypothetical protein